MSTRKNQGNRLRAVLACGILIAFLLPAVLAGCDDETPPPATTPGETSEATTTESTEPEEAPPAETFGAVAIDTHNFTSYALMRDGSVRAWGFNGHGELGTGALGADTATPVQVDELSGITSIAVGASNLYATACAIAGDGLVYCWGGRDLNVGVNRHQVTKTEQPALRGAKKIALGMSRGCAIMSDDTVSCWDSREQPTPLPQLTDIIDIYAGRAHMCALNREGQVLCWGDNFRGQSNPHNPGMNNPVRTPLAVEGVSGATAVGGGSDVSCALLQDTSVVCWGEDYRQIGTVPNSSNTVALSSGWGKHVCMVKQNGELYCWGDNTHGQLGVAPETERRSNDVVRVPGVENVIAAATAYNGEHTCALTSDGKVYCWGNNRYGALGNATLQNTHLPQEVIGLTERALPEPQNGFHALPEIAARQVLPDELPDGCQPAANLSISLSNEPTLDSFPLRYAQARIESNGERIVVHLRNYHFDPEIHFSRLDQNPRGMQGYLSMTVIHETVTGEGDDRVTTRNVVAPGTYHLGRLTTEEERQTVSDARYSYRNETSFFQRDGHYPALELTYVGQDFVCGTLSLGNNDNSMSGSFVAPVR